MERPPIKISWDELQGEKVQHRLREEAGVRATKEHYERADVVAPKITKAAGLRAWLLQSIVYLTFFGVLGGVMGWSVGRSLSLRHDRVEDARVVSADIERLDRAEAAGTMSGVDAALARARLYELGAQNPEFNGQAVAAGGEAVDRERMTRENDRRETWIADLILFGASGLCIGAALASADRTVEGDWRGAAVGASLGAILGAIGGIAVAYATDAVDARWPDEAGQAASLAQRMLWGAASWTLLGALVAAAPGLATGSLRRTLIGVGGGLAGGAVGGFAFEPIAGVLGDANISRLVALTVIGGATGLAIGWIEGIAKQGWLRVASGLIAGKQFILYRNPTFVGSAPMSHIYLFRDAKVGRRHAAIFQVKGGFEIENLPLGGATLVNGKPIQRHRLRTGDKIAIGNTTLVFEEKDAS